MCLPVSCHMWRERIFHFLKLIFLILSNFWYVWWLTTFKNIRRFRLPYCHWTENQYYRILLSIEHSNYCKRSCYSLPLSFGGPYIKTSWCDCCGHFGLKRCFVKSLMAWTRKNICRKLTKKQISEITTCIIPL